MLFISLFTFYLYCYAVIFWYQTLVFKVWGGSIIGSNLSMIVFHNFYLDSGATHVNGQLTSLARELKALSKLTAYNTTLLVYNYLKQCSLTDIISKLRLEYKKRYLVLSCKIKILQVG